MKFPLLSLVLVLLAAFAFAAGPQKSVIVSYPENTPDSVLDKAKDAIRKAVSFIAQDGTLPLSNNARAGSSRMNTI